MESHENYFVTCRGGHIFTVPVVAAKSLGGVSKMACPTCGDRCKQLGGAFVPTEAK
jgi:hypothetical protein